MFSHSRGGLIRSRPARPAAPRIPPQAHNKYTRHELTHSVFMLVQPVHTVRGLLTLYTTCSDREITLCYNHAIFTVC